MWGGSPVSPLHFWIGVPFQSLTFWLPWQISWLLESTLPFILCTDRLLFLISSETPSASHCLPNKLLISSRAGAQTHTHTHTHTYTLFPLSKTSGCSLSSPDESCYHSWNTLRGFVFPSATAWEDQVLAGSNRMRPVSPWSGAAQQPTDSSITTVASAQRQSWPEQLIPSQPAHLWE